MLEQARENFTVQLTSSLTGLEMCIHAVQNSVHPALTAISKQRKQEINCTVILPPSVFLEKARKQ